MNELTTTLASLLSTLEPALAKLADTICVSIDYIKENAMQYILMYGQYYWIQDVVLNVSLLGIFVGLVVCIPVFMMWSYVYEEILNLDESPTFKKSIRNTIIGFFSWCAFVFIVTSLPYWISPEMYSIKAVMNLINGGGF